MSARTLRERLRLGLEHARHVPGLRKDLLTIAALMSLGVLVGGYIVVHQRMDVPWNHQMVFSADFQSVPGISPGNGQEVRIAGVTVGEIKKAEVTDRGTARLTMSIDPGEKIFDNASLVLRPKSPLNEMYVEIDPGGPPAEPISSGTVFPESQTRDPVQPDEVLSHLDDRSRAALTALLDEADVALAHAPENLAPGLASTDRTLTDLTPVVEQLATRRQKIRELVTALAQISSAAGHDDKRLTRLASSMDQTLGVLATNDGQVAATLQRLPGLSAELRHAMTSTHGLTAQLDPTLDDVRRASQVLPPALSRLTETVRQAHDTIRVAEPVIAKGRPIVADLRPIVTDANAALADLRPVTSRLEPVTASLLPYLTDLRAFVYNTASVTSLEDANGGILRGLLVLSPRTLPVDTRKALIGGKR